MGKNVIIFGANMSSSVHIDNINKDILILGEKLTQGLDDTTLTAEGKYPVNLTQSKKRFALSLHHNGSKSFLFVNATKISQFKAKDSEIKDYPLCLGNIWKYFTVNNMKKQDWKTNSNFFSVDFNPIDTNNNLDIDAYLMKRKQYKIMLGLIKKMFMGLWGKCLFNEES